MKELLVLPFMKHVLISWELTGQCAERISRLREGHWTGVVSVIRSLSYGNILIENFVSV
jgi:hypothetical protein